MCRLGNWNALKPHVFETGAEARNLLRDEQRARAQQHGQVHLPHAEDRVALVHGYKILGKGLGVLRVIEAGGVCLFDGELESRHDALVRWDW